MFFVKSGVMIKKTLYFGNPVYLHLKNSQLMIKDPAQDSSVNATIASIPVEDIGLVVLDHPRISITQTFMIRLLENNSAIILFNDSHMPVSLTLSLTYNHTYSEKVKYQLDASEPLKKQLWRQTIDVSDLLFKSIVVTNLFVQRTKANHNCRF
jgi:CRISP-associated protein Cas1